MKKGGGEPLISSKGEKERRLSLHVHDNKEMPTTLAGWVVLIVGGS